MSVKINGTTITLTRGDTLNVKLNLTDSEGEPFIPSENDSIRFAMKKNIADRKTLIFKEIPIDTLTLRLESEETKNLPQPSEYVYDIQITMEDGTVNTFVDRAKFIITEEVD